MSDLWQEIPKDEYWDTFRNIVNFSEEFTETSGDIYLLKVDYLIKVENIYFYALGGKFYIQSAATPLSEVKHMKLKKEKNKKTLKIIYHTEHKSYFDRNFYYESDIILERTRTKVPKLYSVGYDCEYHITVNGNKVEIKGIDVNFPDEFKKKINLE